MLLAMVPQEAPQLTPGLARALIHLVQQASRRSEEALGEDLATPLAS